VSLPRDGTLPKKATKVVMFRARDEYSVDEAGLVQSGYCELPPQQLFQVSSDEHCISL
jgi:hypothetical protein